MKIKHKKIFIITLISALLILTVIVLFLLIRNHNKITFYYDGKAQEQVSKTIEYSDAIDYSPKAIKLQAKQNNKDITNQIKVDKVIMDKLKTYSITYRVEDATFIYHLKVIDTTKPTLSGKSEIEITQTDAFDYALCEVKANDNYDKEIQNKIKVSGEVNSNVANTYPITFQVEDVSHNKASFVCNVIVKEKPMLPQAPQSNASTRNTVNNPNDITVLVNKQNALPDGWAPTDLVAIGGNHYLRAEAANQLQAMRSAATNAGIAMNVVSSYRSQTYQANLYQSYYAKDPANAPFYSALPRTSEHKLGLAVDLSYDSQLHADLQNSSLGVWLAQHAHEYGYVLRYDNNKTNITGYMYEPWHYRYVGVALATQLRNSHMVLEEYY